MRPLLSSLCLLLLTLSACGTDDIAPHHMDMEEPPEDMPRPSQTIPPLPTGSLDMSETLDMAAEDMRMPPAQDDMSPTTPQDMGMMGEEDMGMSSPDMSVQQQPCRLPRTTDLARTVVISTPYNKDITHVPVYRVLTLETTGELVDTRATFEMGVATDGEIAFTPDGSIGVARQKDGSVGIFEVEASGAIRVIEASWTGGMGAQLYASSIQMSPEGDAFYLINKGWRNVGGSVWRVPLDCQTGEPGIAQLMFETKLAHAVAMHPENPDLLLLAAHDVLQVMDRHDLYAVDMSATPGTLAGQARVFLDDDASISSLAIMPSGAHALLADTNLFGSPTTNNRVGVIEVLSDGSMRALQTLFDIKDPASLRTSPFNNAALVTSAEGNRIVVLDYDPSQTEAPFSTRGTLATSTTARLPIDTAMVSRGALKGSVLVSENTSVRVVKFEPDASVVETSLLQLGEDVQHIVGAIGVQP